MKTRLIVLVIAACFLPAGAKAQLTVEMANIRCEQYLAMAPAQSRDFSAWMSGWYSYKIDKSWVDLVAHQKNIANVQAWCRYHLKETVMSGLEKALEGK
jgi:hypothetical protein